jgi:hypothetical protein
VQPCRLHRLTVYHPLAQEIENNLSLLLDDKRIVFKTGPHPLLSAQFETPKGIITL